jgi:serine/threonine protein kinase
LRHHDPLALVASSPPFDRFKNLKWLGSKRRGRKSHEHARHHLFIGRGRHNPVNVLIKVTARPGRVYEHDLDNEIKSLTTINRELPDSRHFPFIHDHGRLADGRLYLVMSLFDEFPLATTIGEESAPARLVSHLRIAIEIARVLADIHRLEIFHVDLNPMNILYGTGGNRPVIRVVDFESSYERRRHTAGTVYSPPITPGFSAPEVSRQAPDASADVFSLGAVLHTLLAGSRWMDGSNVAARVADDDALDGDLKAALVTAVDPAPAKRYASMLVFQAALGAYLERIWPGRAEGAST